MTGVTGFTPAIRDAIREGTQRSARVVVPMLLAEFPHVRRVVDVGCGEGWWAREFAARLAPLGGAALGVDYDVDDGQEPGLGFVHADLRAPFTVEDDLGPFDLAVSLEVAEHLPPERAAGFVADLCALAPIVAFSAAIPGQGGTGHLNEQPPDWWASAFAEHGYTASGYLRRRLWHDSRVENWYAQNLLIAVASEAWNLMPDPAACLADHPPHYVRREKLDPTGLQRSGTFG